MHDDRYTMSIRTILNENKHTGEDITNISDIYAIAARSIFDLANMNVIDSDYRQRLITGFTLHYMNDEICDEEILLFKIGLAEKIYNNAEYINKIFENLDNQVFADYQTKAVSSTGTDTITDAGTISNTGTVETAKSGDDTLKRTGTTADAHTGTITNSEHVDDTLTKTGSETTTHNTTDTTVTDGSVTKTDGSTTTNNTTDRTVTDGTVVTTGGDKYTQTTSNSGTSKSNTGSYALDAPQNAILNIRSTNEGGYPVPYDATGKGISANAESDMKYMSSASLADGTVVNSDSQTVSHDATLSSTTSDDDTTITLTKTGTVGVSGTSQTEDDTTVTTTRGGTDSVGFTNRQDDRDVSKSGTETFNDTQTRTDNLQDKTEYNSETTVTNNTLQTKSNETTKESETGSTETSKALNMEILYRSMPLLNVIWNMFDELFMSIY